ncbi:MAG: hypothetical protein M3Y73_05665 [Actinomycetota bacterium]|nr:hypothetical protein [Actinomycetota bacterium]
MGRPPSTRTSRATLGGSWRSSARLQLRHDLAVAFAAFEATHFAGVTAVDKDPESYVREVEEEIAASNDRGDDRADKAEGSLGIGGLKGG